MLLKGFSEDKRRIPPRTPNKSFLESQGTELVCMTVAEQIGQEEEILLRTFWYIPGLGRGLTSSETYGLPRRRLADRLIEWTVRNDPGT